MNRSQKPEGRQISPRTSPKTVSQSHFTKNTSPDRNLDSKRLIGKSRIFNYLNS